MREQINAWYEHAKLASPETNVSELELERLSEYVELNEDIEDLKESLLEYQLKDLEWIFKTGENLEKAIDNDSEIVNEMAERDTVYGLTDEYLTFSEAEGKVFTGVPYWVEPYSLDLPEDCGIDNAVSVFREGCYVHNMPGDVVPLEDIEYVMVGTISGSEETEIQAEDGKCGYVYVGYNFIEIYVPLYDILTAEMETIKAATNEAVEDA